MPCVVDSSVSMAWVFEDEATPYTDSILHRLASDSAVVPSVWPLEVANTLVLGERRGRVSQARAAAFLTQLESLPITVESAPSLDQCNILISLAREHRLTAYDASYLELAIREGLPLATLDGDLRAAAQRAGVPLL